MGHFNAVARSHNKLKIGFAQAVLLIFALYTVSMVISFWQAGERELIGSFDDDAYYYFKIAQNFARAGQLTFDGQTQANGFHPLWMLMLLPMFEWIHDPVLVLRVIGSLSAALTGMTAMASLHYLYTRYSWFAASITAGLILTCLIAFGSAGMETVILLPLISLALVALDKAQPWRREQPATKSLIVAGLALSLMQLARLDSVLLSLVLVVICGIANHSAAGLKRLAWLALPSVVTGGLYLMTLYARFGYFIPTSGLVKSAGYSGLNAKFVAQLLNPRSAADGSLWPLFLAALILSIGYVMAVLLIKWKGVKDWRTNQHFLASIVAVFFIVYVGYQLLRTSWVLWRWYAYPLWPFSLFVFPVILDAVWQRLVQVDRLNRVMRPAGGVVAAFVCGYMLIQSVSWGWWSRQSFESNQYDSALIANTLNQRLPPSAIVGMGDRAGSFAYFFDGRVLQLEGLVGDYALLQAVESNALVGYMSKFGVNYLLAYADLPFDYSRSILLMPRLDLSSGPHAEVPVCSSRELAHYTYGAEVAYLWRWPSCES